MAAMISRTLYLFGTFLVLTMAATGLGVLAFLLVYCSLMAL